MEKHFTATVYILDGDRVLLIHHRKFNKWLPPGGHIDPNEIPSDAAKREALEETGLEIELLKQENIWITSWNANSIERPYLCLLEEVPAYGDKPAHKHIDFIYLAKPIGGREKINPTETEGMHWFTLEEINALKSDEEIFAETQKTLRHIMSTPIVTTLYDAIVI